MWSNVLRRSICPTCSGDGDWCGMACPTCEGHGHVKTPRGQRPDLIGILRQVPSRNKGAMEFELRLSWARDDA